MASINDWNKYINLEHDLAWIEDDLRDLAVQELDLPVAGVAQRLLYEHFGTIIGDVTL